MSLCILRWYLPFPINFGVIYLWGSAPQLFTTPFITQKKFCSVYRVHGTQNDRLELTILMNKSVLKNMHRVLRNMSKCPKIWTGSGDINQNVLKSGSPNQTCIFWNVFANISRPGAYFSKPIFALKPWAQAGRFEYHESYIWKNFFSDLFRGPDIFHLLWSL